MSTKIDQALHEKLCAYVLGELEGAERAELEHELARSAELRAEKERLEGTIGLVRDALAEGESLPWRAHRELERAARPSWAAQVPWMRLAAGISAVGLGWWIFARGAGRFDGSVPREVEVARGFAQPAPDAERASPVQLKEQRTAAAAQREQPDARAKDKIEVVSAFSEAKPAGGAGGVPAATHAPAQKAAPAALPAAIVAPATTLDSNLGFSSTPSAGVGSVPGLASAGEKKSDASASHYGAAGRPGLADAGRAGGAPAPTAAATAPPPAPAGVATGGGGGGSGTYRGPGDTIASKASTEGKEVLLHLAEPKPESGRLVKRLKENKLDEEVAYEEDNFIAGLGYTGPADDDDAHKARARWRQLTPEQREMYLDARCRRIVLDCQRRPNERPRDMFFRFWGDNPFEVTALDRLSTFSIDVDTASYALARRYLNEGNVPEKAQVRTEEFVNYFASDVPAPRSGTFAVHSDLTPSRFSADAARQMLRVVVRAQDVEKLERQPLRLTFVVDVSGSMREQNRMETVKNALRMLVAQLEPRDSIGIVKFSTDASLVLPMTPVVDRTVIEAAIAPLEPGGSTNSNAGLQLGYAQALSGLDPAAVNRVVFLSDGVANVGETDPQKMLDGVRTLREKGIYLNTIGVGMNNHNDTLLEQLADKGDGLCNYVDSPKEIQRALVDRFTGAFQPVAKDVKIQVEFDPDQVLRYRLLGYENRAIADADFRNDAVDAGEVGAGQQVTALYELEPTGRRSEKPLATVRLRWKPIVAAGTPPAAQEAVEAAFPVMAASYQAYESSPPGHRRALIVAQFAEILRRSIHARGESLDDLIREAELLRRQVPQDQDFAEFCALLVRSKELVLRDVPECDDLCQAVDLLRNTWYLHATAEEAGRDQKLLQEIERTTKDLEARVRELLRSQLERQVR